MVSKWPSQTSGPCSGRGNCVGRGGGGGGGAPDLLPVIGKMSEEQQKPRERAVSVFAEVKPSDTPPPGFLRKHKSVSS